MILRALANFVSGKRRGEVFTMNDILRAMRVDWGRAVRVKDYMIFAERFQVARRVTGRGRNAPLAEYGWVKLSDLPGPISVLTIPDDEEGEGEATLGASNLA